MANAANRVFADLFSSSTPQGDERPAYVALVLKLLATINAGPVLTNPAAECIRQVELAVGADSLAAKDFAKQLNQSRDHYARAN